MSAIAEGTVAYRLGQIAYLATIGHRHNCGQGPAPRDCSRLDEIAQALRDLALDLPREDEHER